VNDLPAVRGGNACRDRVDGQRELLEKELAEVRQAAANAAAEAVSAASMMGEDRDQLREALTETRRQLEEMEAERARIGSQLRHLDEQNSHTEAQLALSLAEVRVPPLRCLRRSRLCGLKLTPRFSHAVGPRVTSTTISSSISLTRRSHHQAEKAAALAEKLEQAEAELEAARSAEEEASTENQALHDEVDHWVRVAQTHAADVEPIRLQLAELTQKLEEMTHTKDLLADSLALAERTAAEEEIRQRELHQELGAMGAQLEQAARANAEQVDMMTARLEDTNMKAQRLWSMHVGVRQELQEHLEQYIRVISYLMKETKKRLDEEAHGMDKADEHEQSPTSLLMFWTEKAEKPKSPLRYSNCPPLLLLVGSSRCALHAYQRLRWKCRGPSFPATASG
jgi:chromosome segregation ATPase